MTYRVIAGIMMIVSSFPLFGGGAFVAMQGIDEKNRLEVQKQETEAQCIRHLEGIPNAKVTNAANTRVVISPVTDPHAALTSASIAIMSCPTKNLEEMCLGDHCEPNKKDVTLVMKFVPSND